jgi:hypothetical protein
MVLEMLIDSCECKYYIKDSASTHTTIVAFHRGISSNIFYILP